MGVFRIICEVVLSKCHHSQIVWSMAANRWGVMLSPIHKVYIYAGDHALLLHVINYVLSLTHTIQLNVLICAIVFSSIFNAISQFYFIVWSVCWIWWDAWVDTLTLPKRIVTLPQPRTGAMRGWSKQRPTDIAFTISCLKHYMSEYLTKKKACLSTGTCLCTLADLALHWLLSHFPSQNTKTKSATEV